MKRFVIIWVCILNLLLFSCQKSKDNYYRISVKEYIDKAKAAWIGQMVGVGWGASTEFKYIFKIMPQHEIPVWNDSMVNQYFQDDLYVEMTFLRTLEKYGLDVSTKQAGIDFANSTYGLACANETGRENLRAGIAPPESGHPDFGFSSDDIDYQIEADYSGIISPGLPNSVIHLGEKFGKIMNYGDGVYGGQFMGGMYAAAFFEKNIKKIVEAGLKCIPEKSDYAQCVRDVMNWYSMDSMNWKNTWTLIDNKYRKDSTYQKLAVKNRKSWPGIDAKLNGAFVVLGLLYGKGNLDSTICISMRAGLDSDCNPSSAAGVLFTSIGLDKLPEKFKAKLDFQTMFSNTEYNFNSLNAVCEKLARNVILKNGGLIEKDNNGEEYFYIPKTAVVCSALEQSYNAKAANKTNLYTKSEMKLILVHPSKVFQPVLDVVAKGWRAGNCGKTIEPGFVQHRGRKNVLAIIAPNENTACYLSKDIEMSKGKNAKLKFWVSCGDDQEWILDIYIQWKKEKSIVINDEFCIKGWKEIVFDLKEYSERGKLFMQLDGRAGKNGLCKTYWDKIRVEY